jgi:fatty acid desaturase
VSVYVQLLRQVQRDGLLKRCYGFYWTMIIGMVLATAVIGVGILRLGNSWYQLVLAGLLGAVLAQFGFLGHEAAHRQIFKSGRWNEWAARVISGLLTGLSYGWWINKHNRHHQAPNQVGKDPDIVSRVMAFTPEAARGRKGLAAAAAKRQGYLLFPLLLLEGPQLHVASIRTVVAAAGVKYRWVEALFLAVHFGGYLALLAAVLPPGKAAAFLAVQLSVFGFLLGAAFAPNHKGMPWVPANASIDFFRRQVVMSRNIRGGRLLDFAMGGLNRQIEHHLFPDMPRPNLRRVRHTVRTYCREHGVPYTETSLGESYGIIVRYLNQVGLRSKDPFRCPLVQQYRG